MSPLIGVCLFVCLFSSNNSYYYERCASAIHIYTYIHYKTTQHAIIFLLLLHDECMCLLWMFFCLWFRTPWHWLYSWLSSFSIFRRLWTTMVGMHNAHYECILNGSEAFIPSVWICTHIICVYLKIEFTAVTIERHNIRSHMFYMTWIHLNSVLNDVDRHHSLHAQHYVF